MKTTKSLFGILTITMALAVQVQAQSFVWTQLATNIPSDWNGSPASIDTHHGIIFSLSQNGDFWEYSIQSNTFTQLPVSGWPGGASGQQPYANAFIYNPDENTIWLTLNGRGQVFRLPVTGGTVTSVGASGAPETDFGNLNYWNPVTHAMGSPIKAGVNGKNVVRSRFSFTG